MNNTTPDPAEPIGDVTVVKDFLPPPEQLIPKRDTVRATIEFTQNSIGSSVLCVKFVGWVEQSETQHKA